MAGAFFAELGGNILANGIGSLIGAGANAINQRVEFEYNQQLQSNSFQHDKDMLAAQVAATKHLQQAMIGVKQDVLRQAGFTDADAARGAIGAQMTRMVDWNGTRYYAPNAMRASGYSGMATNQLVFSRRPAAAPEASTVSKPETSRVVPGDAQSAGTGSWEQLQASRTTRSATLTSRSADTSTYSRASRRTQEWVEQQKARAPFTEGALRTAFVSPPQSTMSSPPLSDGASTVRGSLLDSWTPAFNTHRQPAFAFIRRRGESNA
uniref:Small basic protein VP2 n=1 Tax=Norovirus cat/GVI.2/TE/77-13/ITA TaxID=1761663 RepID=A0A0S2XKF4_NORV|nr:small basic protein VP2 [Norovirus cat/GVI.2/TE/77-13/ITA]